MERSYLAVCNMALARLDCPSGKSVINNLGVKIVENGVTIPPYTCACGAYTVPSGRVSEVIIDKINDLPLSEMPIFEDPINLSLQFSIALLFIVGKLAAVVAKGLHFPPIIGFLLAGVAIQVLIGLHVILMLL